MLPEYYLFKVLHVLYVGLVGMKNCAVLGMVANGVSSIIFGTHARRPAPPALRRTCRPAPAAHWPAPARNTAARGLSKEAHGARSTHAGMAPIWFYSDDPALAGTEGQARPFCIWTV